MGRFLEALAETGNVTEACRLSGLPRRTAYELRDRDAEFDERWQDALDEGVDLLEREARRRAIEGIEEPIFYQGEVVGHVRRFSDSLLQFLLRGRRPEVFAPNWVDPAKIREQAQRELVLAAADYLEELAERRGMSRVEVLKGFQRALEAGDDVGR